MATNQILVLGGAGALGRSLISRFTKASWSAINVDIGANSDASQNILINDDVSAKHLVAALQPRLGRPGGFRAIVNAAGGWVGGRVGDADFFDGYERMWKQNVQSSVIAAHLASQLLTSDGLLVLTGAFSATLPTPDMIAYGITKAAVHQLARSLATDGLSQRARVVALLPHVIDTPSNRQGMPGADFSNWTPPEHIAAKVYQWAVGQPPEGTFVDVVTKQGATSFTKVELYSPSS
eukprot:GILJ01001831.1.p1 GENE.GILJ01001831.1~~GILJ01001831.1.p1  ORF type:complete len:236 (+),score=29.60 GILJ01001831.1:45-752(+)